MKAFILLVAAMSTGCGAAAAHAPTLLAAPAATVATPVCAGAPAPATPLVVDHDPASRVALEASTKNGVVLVAYDRATLRVLPYCHVAVGGYAMASVSQLAQVLRRDGLDLVVATDGVRATTVDAVTKGELGGSCEGVTHFVKTESLAALSAATSPSAAW